jgi:hypothetical protein
MRYADGLVSSLLSMLIWIDRAKILLQATCAFPHDRAIYYWQKSHFDLNSILVAVPVVLHNLDPVIIGIQHECNGAHAAVRQSLLPIDLKILKSLASGVQVINRNAYSINISLEKAR